MTGSSGNGQENFHDNVEEDWDSEDSEFLLEVFERNDDRPVYVEF